MTTQEIKKRSSRKPPVLELVVAWILIINSLSYFAVVIMLLVKREHSYPTPLDNPFPLMLNAIMAILMLAAGIGMSKGKMWGKRYGVIVSITVVAYILQAQIILHFPLHAWFVAEIILMGSIGIFLFVSIITHHIKTRRAYKGTAV